MTIWQDKYRRVNEFRGELLEKDEFKTWVEERFREKLPTVQKDLQHILVQEALQKFCPHPPEFINYNPDPSGNNGSWHDCEICGKDIG